MGRTVWLTGDDDLNLKNNGMLAVSWFHLACFGRPVRGTLEYLWSLFLDHIPRPSWRWTLSRDILRMRALALRAGGSWLQSADNTASASEALETRGGVRMSTGTSQL